MLVCPYGALMASESGVMQECELCIENAGGKRPACGGLSNKAIIFEEGTEHRSPKYANHRQLHCGHSAVWKASADKDKDGRSC